MGAGAEFEQGERGAPAGMWETWFIPTKNKQAKINRVDSLEISMAAHSHLNNRGPSL